MQTATSPASRANVSRRAVPGFLVHWEPWWPSFLQNLADIFRRDEPYISRCAPGKFWPDVFVQRPLPWTNFAQSGTMHALVAVLLFGFSSLWLQKPVITDSPFNHTTITYHSISEYLPEVKSEPVPAPAKPMVKPDPAFAKQKITSVPLHPDNASQTILNPPHPEILRTEAKLPNLIVNTAVPAPPVAALTPKLPRIPELVNKPVAPSPEVRANARALPSWDAAVAQPAPDVQRNIASKLPDVAPVQPVQPVPDTHTAVRSFDMPVATPALPVPATSAATSHLPAPVGETAQAVAPAPSTSSPGSALQPSGQLVALSIAPAPPAAEIKVPDASRHGTFEASPNGKLNASGAPNLPANIAANTGNGSSVGKAGATNNEISVSTPPANSIPSALAGTPKPATSDLKNLMAKASVPDLTHQPLRVPEGNKIEDQVFHGRRSYSLQLNMPNLTSAGGSWIIHFAELKQTSTGDVTTPEATRKVDPAYPPALMEERVEGTVFLYAVIHADGSVGEVRVLHGFNDQLDENARIALGKWRFRPALKNGAPVDLEAVVQVPFKLRSQPF